MESWMNFIVSRKMQFIGDWVDLLCYGEGSNVSGTQLSARQAQSDVTGREPHFRLGLVGGSGSSSAWLF